MTNATGVIMHGGNLLTTTATGLITDGRGLPMVTLTGLITEAPIITGVPSRGRHRSSIRTDRRLVDRVCRDALRKLLRKKAEKIERPRRARPVKCGQPHGRTLLKRTSGIGKGKRAAEDAAARASGKQKGLAACRLQTGASALGTGAI